MNEPTIGVEPAEYEGVAGSTSSTRAAQALAGSTGIETVRSACRSLTAFGEWAGWGFAVLGILCGAVLLMEWAGSGPAGPAGWARACSWAAFAVLAFVLAGWGVTALTRAVAASMLAHLEWVAQLSEQMSMRALEARALLERALVAP